MQKFKDTQSGRCFIIGNGPSLRVEDLEALSKEKTFASNRIYGIFSKTQWRPTFYVSQDYNVLREIKGDLYNVSHECEQMILCGNMIRLFPRKLRKKSNVSFINIANSPNGKNFFDLDVTDGIHNGINVTYTMIELALFMGFSEIYLIGVDNNYALKKNNQGKLIVDNESPNSYFEGIAPLKHETIINNNTGGVPVNATLAYANIRKYLEDKSQKVFNATRGGKLEVFERVNLDDILKKM
ncbi:MAG: DUF115 domain-containing protein [Fibrobacter sp.]|nr:DUF115 domain-containing protein [Fibrobacter sp.]